MTFTSKYLDSIDKQTGIKNLIYIVAFGSEYQIQANMLIDSLRKNGKYKDDIICLIDKEHLKLKSETIITNTDIKPILLRMHADNFINFKKYKQIMYLDADIICVKPIQELFKACDCLLYTEEQWNSDGNMIYFNDDEKMIFKNKNGINSGSFCINSGLIYQLFNVWKNILKVKKHCNKKIKHFLDQAAFNFLIRKQLIPCKEWDLGKIGFPHNKIPRKNGILIHYTYNKKLMQADFDHFIQP